jgi:hypothetical protein
MNKLYKGMIPKNARKQWVIKFSNYSFEFNILSKLAELFKELLN